MRLVSCVVLCLAALIAWGHAGDDKKTDKADKDVKKSDKDAKTDKDVKKGEKDKDKDAKDKKSVSALPPHPLDAAFERAASERDLYNALLNNPHYRKAVAEAFKAGREQFERMKKNPELRDATPGQAARRRFLEVLAGEK